MFRGIGGFQPGKAVADRDTLIECHPKAETNRCRSVGCPTSCAATGESICALSSECASSITSTGVRPRPAYSAAGTVTF